jgi:uncharacterized membrane protein
MQGLRRKVIYVATFEAIAITVCSFAFSRIADKSLGHSSMLAVMTSIVAVVWNFTFTSAFEAWERRQAVRGRSFKRRVAHACCFELGLIVLIVPMMAWWLDMSLLHALVMDIGLVAFFLAYTFIFNYCFDRIFGLPSSAQPST